MSTTKRTALNQPPRKKLLEVTTVRSNIISLPKLSKRRKYASGSSASCKSDWANAFEKVTEETRYNSTPQLLAVEEATGGSFFSASADKSFLVEYIYIGDEDGGDEEAESASSCRRLFLWFRLINKTLWTISVKTMSTTKRTTLNQPLLQDPMDRRKQRLLWRMIFTVTLIANRRYLLHSELKKPTL